MHMCLLCTRVLERFVSSRRPSCSHSLSRCSSTGRFACPRLLRACAALAALAVLLLRPQLVPAAAREHVEDRMTVLGDK